MSRKKTMSKEMQEKIKLMREENEFIMSQELERLVRSWTRKGIPIRHSSEVMTDFSMNFAFSTHPSAKDASHEIMKSMSRELLHKGEIAESLLKVN